MHLNRGRECIKYTLLSGNVLLKLRFFFRKGLKKKRCKVWLFSWRSLCAGGGGAGGGQTITPKNDGGKL